MEEDRSKLYAYIISKLNRESMDKFKHHPHYNLVQESLSPLGLLIFLKEIHSLNTPSTNTLINKREAFQQYAATEQGAFETLYYYKEKFEFVYENYIEQGNEKKENEDIALDFLYRLDDNKYGIFVAEIINNIQKGSIAHPENINEIFIMANTRVVVSRGQMHKHSATFSTIEAHSNNERWVEAACKKTGATKANANQPKTKKVANSLKGGPKNKTTRKKVAGSTSNGDEDEVARKEHAKKIEEKIFNLELLPMWQKGPLETQMSGGIGLVIRQ